MGAKAALEIVDCEIEPLIDDGGEEKPLHPGQKRAWHSPRRYVAIFAGWRSGKTVLGPWWILREMQRNGPGDYGVLAPSYPMLDNKARPELLRVLRKKLGSKSYSTSGNIITITPYGCLKLWGMVSLTEVRILMRHADRAEAIEAFDAKGLWVDEPGQIEGNETWEAIQARVSIGRYRILLTSRPFKINWYIKEIWDRVMGKSHQRRADADEQIEVINFKSTDNPAFSQEEYDRQKGRMRTWRFMMKFDGIPTKAAGGIYDCFDESTHTCPRFPIPDHWPRVKGTDFGTKNMAGVFAAKNPDTGVYYVYRSYHRPGESWEGHISNWRLGEPTDTDEITRDPTDYGGSGSENDWRAEFAEHGYIILKPKIGDVDTGIQCVYAMFATRKLMIFADLQTLISKVENYSQKITEEGEPIPDTIEDKAANHHCDCLRYLCVGVTYGADTSVTVRNRKGEDEKTKRAKRDEDDYLYREPTPGQYKDFGPEGRRQKRPGAGLAFRR